MAVFRYLLGPCLLLALAGPLWAAAQETPPLLQVQSLIRQDKLEQAENLLEKLLAEDADNGEALFWMSEVYRRQHDYLSASEWLQRAIDQAPDNMQLRLRQAELLSESGQLEQAEAAYRAMLELTRNTAEIQAINHHLLLTRGKRLLQAKQWEQAVALYQAALEDDPRDIEILEALGDTYTAMGAWSEAEETYRRILNIDPMHTETYLRLGRMYASKGDHLARWNMLQKLISLDPESESAKAAIDDILSRASLLLVQQDLEAAEAEVETILEILPNHVEANLTIAQVYRQQEQYDAAELAYQRVLQQNPKDWRTRSQLAALYFKAGRLEQAIAEYRKILKAIPDSDLARQADARLNVIYGVKAQRLAESLLSEQERDQALETARAWIEDQRYDAAQWLLEAIIEHYPRHAPAHYWLGILYEKKKLYRRASEALRRALLLDRNAYQAQLAYGRILFRLGDLLNAETVLLDLQDRAIDSDMRQQARQWLDLTRGERLLRAGRPRAALEHYLRMQTRTPEDLELMARLINVHTILGNEAKAEELYQRMLKIELANLNEKQLLQNGRKLLEQNQLKKAKAVFNNLLRINPEHVQAHYWLGIVYMKRKEYDAGIEHIRRSVELAPDNTKLRKAYAQNLIQAGRLGEAYQLYEDMLLSAMDNIEYREIRRLQGLAKAELHRQANDLFGAINQLHALSLMYPADADILEKLATLYTRLEFWEDAANAYQLALRLQPRRAQTHLRLAHMYELQNKPLQRLEHLRRAIELEPTGKAGTVAANTLLKDAERFLRQGRLQAALITLNSVLLAQPRHLAANLAIAEVYRRMGRLDEAETAYMKVLLQRPVDIDVRAKLAALYVQARRYDDAITEFHRIIALAPASPQSRDARVNLGIVHERKTDVLLENLTTSEDKDKAVEYAKTLIDENRLRPAFRLLSKVVEKFPDDAKGQYWLATLYERRNQLDLAVEHAARSVSLMPDNYKLRMAYARILARAGKLDEAETVYKQVVEQSGDAELAAKSRKLLGFLNAQRLLLAGKTAAALAHYQSMLTRYPGDASILSQIAGLELALGRPEKARGIYEDLLRKDPANAAIHMRLAQLAQARGDQQASIEHLKQVLKHDPRGPLGRQAVNALGLGEGNKYLLAKQWDKALAQYARVLDVDPENVLAHLGLAEAYFNMGQIKKSEQAVDTVLKIDPAQVDARLHKAKILVQTNRVQKAIIELERILAMAKGSRQARKAVINLGNIYRSQAASLSRRGKWASAIKQYERAIEKNPDDLRAHMELGRIYQRDPRYQEEAMQEYQEVIRIDPTHTRAYLNIGTLYENKREYDKALEAFVTALSHLKEPRLMKRVINLVRLQVVRQQFMAKNYDWAIAELQDMLKLEPNKASLYLFLSTIQRRKGDFDAAIASLRQAIALDPKNIVARFRLGLLYEQISEDKLALAQYRQITSSGRRGTVVESARNRIPILEERLKVFNFVVNYSINGSETEIPGAPTTSSFTSTLRFDLAARLKPTKNFDLSLRASPAYSAYHDSQNDAIIPTYGINGRLNFRDTFLILDVLQQKTEGLLLEDFRGETVNGSLTLARRLRIPLFLGEEETTIPQTLSLRLGFRDFWSPGVTQLATRAYSATTSFTYPFRRGGSWGVDYTFTDVQNSKIAARDYAYRGHRLGVSYSKILGPKFTAYLNAGFELKLHSFPDSRTRVEARREQKRIAGTSNVSVRLNYLLHRKMTLFASLASNENRTNLPRGFIYNDQGRPIGVQGSSLGIYQTASATLGMQFRF